MDYDADSDRSHFPFLFNPPPAGPRTVAGREGVPRMIKEGTRAPGFKLKDHLGREISLQQFQGKRHVMLLFYPLDWTPT
jgi:hypothetical protein